MKIIIVGKDKFKTQFAQAAAVFEDFKFFGVITEIDAKITKPLPEVLANLRKMEDDKYEVVGIVVPNVGAVFIDGHKVYSDGDKWFVVEEMCKVHGAELEVIKEPYPYD